MKEVRKHSNANPEGIIMVWKVLQAEVIGNKSESVQRENRSHTLKQSVLTKLW